MGLLLTIFWTAVVSLCALGAAWYAKRHERPDALIGLYVTLVIAANILASKIVEFDLWFGTFFAPGAVLVFAVTFLLTDIVNERFGRQETQRMILIAFVGQLIFLFFSYMVVSAKGAPFFADQKAFETVLGAAPRVAFAGLVTFFISESLDASLYQWFRKVTGGRHLWVRNIFSSVPAMALDSVLFVTIAFAGTTPIWPLIVGLTVVKWLVAVVDIPFMYLARNVLRR